MTVHMFRVFIGPGKMSISDLETRINDWVASNPEWENDTVDHTLGTYTNLNGEIIARHTDVRFTEDDTKANLLQKLTDKLKNKVDWYRVGYHECPHDGTTRSASESRSLAPGDSVDLNMTPTPDTDVTIGSGGYTSGDDYTLDGRVLSLPQDSSISAGTHTVAYETKQCGWDDNPEWTAKDVTIPSGVPTFEVPA